MATATARASVSWERSSEDFAFESYSRDHLWRFENGVAVEASAAPAFLGSEDRVDPEAAYVASLSSCHMLTFLAIAARKRLVVDRYADAAVGSMEKNEQGRLAITRVTLRPRVEFRDGPPSDDELARLHEMAHKGCFIANSVRTQVIVDPG